MTQPNIVDTETWLAARKELLVAEKEFTRERDRLTARRQSLPAVRVEKPYTFQTERGAETLDDLFAGKRQLMIYHFMFPTDWEAGCKSCSFWADNFQGLPVHLAARDISLKLVSIGSLDKLLGFRERMGWNLDWVSSEGSDFNRDFGVTFDETSQEAGRGYNYTDRAPVGELPGVSVFLKAEDGAILHTYSTYGRGLDILNSAYNLIDLTPIGRDEGDGIMRWLKLSDRYGAGDAL